MCCKPSASETTVTDVLVKVYSLYCCLLAVKQRRMPQTALLKAFNPFQSGGSSKIVKLTCNIYLYNSLGYCVYFNLTHLKLM